MEKGIFDGLKVLDCASFIAAPAAATVLSDFGADVIKIEPPGLRRSLSQPAEPAGLSGRASTISRGCWRTATRRAWRSTCPGRKRRQCCTGSSPKPTSSSPTMPPQVRPKLGITYDHLAHAERSADLRLLHRLWREGRGSQQARLRQQRLLGALRPDGSRARRRRRPRRRARSPAWATIPAPWRSTARSSRRCYQRERTGKGSHVAIESDGERHLGQQRAGAGQALRRQVLRSAGRASRR